MRRSTRLSTKRIPPPANSSDEEEPKKTKPESQKNQNHNLPQADVNQEHLDGSSSESDIENYLKPADQLDLSSSFFQVSKQDENKSFEAIESNIFAGINRLSDSESDSDEDKPVEELVLKEPQKSSKATASKINFQQLHDYTKKLEETKQLVEKYEASKRTKLAKHKTSADKKTDDISSLLAVGEAKADSSADLQNSVHSSDFESYSESEKEDWEEVEEHDFKETEDSVVPKDGVQITVELPGVIRKKKGIDLVACMKRRLNKIRKENQVFVHKVHLLCWLAHGNYVNRVLNNESLLGLALSLIPSQHCYPPERTDLNYLEQIVKWYKNTVVNVDKIISKDVSLEKALKIQINRKQAYNNKMLVYIFICILRSLGIQCRLVLSFQVASLRPPASELHSLSTKTDDKKHNKKKEQQPKAMFSKQESSKKKESKNNNSEENQAKQPDKQQKSKKPNLGNLSGKGKTKNEIKTVKLAEKTSITDSKKIWKKPNLKAVVSKIDADKTGKPKIEQASKSDKKVSEKIKSKTKERANNLEFGISKQKYVSQKPEQSLKGKGHPESIREAKPQSTTKKSDVLKIKLATKAKAAPEFNNPSSNRETKTSDSNEKPIQSVATSQTVLQVDGVNDSDDESAASQTTPKPNLKKLSQEEMNSPSKKYPKRPRSVPNYTEADSGEDFDHHSSNNNVQTDLKRSTATTLKRLKQKPESHQRCPRTSNKDILKTRASNTQQHARSSSAKQLKQKSKSSMDHSPSCTDGGRSQYFGLPSPIKSVDIRNDIISIMKNRIAQEKAVQRNKLVKSRRSLNQSDEDSDYAPEPVRKKHPDSDDEFYEKTKVKVKQRVKVKKDDVTDKEPKKRKGADVWVEVFLEAEEKWISADVVKGQVHCINELYSRATHPITYVVVWNNDNSIKDVTQRYCPDWNTTTRKLRIDKKWWEDSLRPFKGRTTARDREEDEELARLQLEKPLPTTISEYKNHPLYVLKRHLLKFEALYPPEPITLGFIRNEAVYSRDCVHALHSREVWIKHAKVVKPGEKPYKIVKARPKYDKLSGQVITDQPLELFGKWQVSDYIPPTAENGIVPRNAYGNVELFKPSMIPKGTVHLQLPGLNKIARKMNIDCAPAVVGFDYHSGGSHPTFDGFIVCEEHSESLIAAWYMEQEEQEKREQEKIEKRVYGNWRKLIKGLLIRERLKARYDFGGPSQDATKKRKSKGPKCVSKKRRLYSDSESNTGSD